MNLPPDAPCARESSVETIQLDYGGLRTDSCYRAKEIFLVKRHHRHAAVSPAALFLCESLAFRRLVMQISAPTARSIAWSERAAGDSWR
jgi:vancomycin permeability regulator SanA